MSKCEHFEIDKNREGYIFYFNKGQYQFIVEYDFDFVQACSKYGNRKLPSMQGNVKGLIEYINYILSMKMSDLRKMDWE